MVGMSSMGMGMGMRASGKLVSEPIPGIPIFVNPPGIPYTNARGSRTQVAGASQALGMIFWV